MPISKLIQMLLYAFDMDDLDIGHVDKESNRDE